MSKATHMSRLIQHLHSVATESSSAIVLSYSEYLVLLTALSEFKINHTKKGVDSALTPKGIALVDSLYTHLDDYFTDLDNLFAK